MATLTRDVARHAEAPIMPKADRRASARRQALCLETQGREILAEIVHDEVDDAMRVGLYDGVPARIPQTRIPRRGEGKNG